MERSIKRICVFCAAADGNRSEYIEAASQMGRLLVDRGIQLIYGGGGRGLMGALAESVLGRGGEAIGVITQFLVDKELAHKKLTALHIVQTMHERKMMMASLADAFIAMPGGLGTLDELFEIMTWAQLGIHDKPVGLLNVVGYYEPIMSYLDHAASEGFLRLNHRRQVLMHSSPAGLVDLLTGPRQGV
ncbi:MAG: TIGR00730 family Rossman fold protein [Phycisphaerales bacterium]|nr:TIGR00730 family Rossman fold protein [Phycisphaerales bacterium]